MKKIYILIYAFTLLISSQSINDYIDDLIENYDLRYEESLKNHLKKYLIEHNLYESEKLVEPDELRKIFINMMYEGASIDEVDDFTKDMNEELARIFIKKYYKRKKEIRGKDIYDLININEIMQKYYQLNGEMPIYDEDDDFGKYNNNL